MKLNAITLSLVVLVGCSSRTDPKTSNHDNSQDNNGSVPACQSDAECRQWQEGPLRPEEAYCDEGCRDCRDDEECQEGEYCKSKTWCRPFVTTSCETFEDCNPDQAPVRARTCLDNQCVGCGPDAPGPNGVCPDGWICVGTACAQVAASDPACVDGSCDGQCVATSDKVICDDGDDCIKEGDLFVCLN